MHDDDERTSGGSSSDGDDAGEGPVGQTGSTGAQADPPEGTSSPRPPSGTHKGPAGGPDAPKESEPAVGGG